MSESGLVISEFQGVTVVSFRHASILDMAVIDAIGKDLYKQVDDLAKKKIVLDFDAVRFLSSQALGMLISLHKKSKAIGGRVILTALRPELFKAFQIMKLDKLMEFAPTEADAMKKLM